LQGNPYVHPKGQSPQKKEEKEGILVIIAVS